MILEYHPSNKVNKSQIVISNLLFLISSKHILYLLFYTFLMSGCCNKIRVIVFLLSCENLLSLEKRLSDNLLCLSCVNLLLGADGDLNNICSLLGLKFFSNNRFINLLLNNRLSEFLSDNCFLSNLSSSSSFMFFMNHLLMFFMNYRFVNFMNYFLKLFMDHWLMDLSNFFCMYNRLMMFMNDRLMVLMNNILMMFMKNVFVVLMNNISMVLFYNWLISVDFILWCHLVLFDNHLFCDSIDNRLLLMPYN